VDIAGDLRQRAALGFGQGGCGAQARQLAREQDRHHAQIAHDGEQQAAQPFGIARACAFGVQRPHRFRRALAVNQRQHRRVLRRQMGGNGLHPGRERIEHGSGQALAVGPEQDEGIQGVGQYHGRFGQRRRGTRRLRCSAQRRHQRARQRGERGQGQQGIGRRFSGHGNQAITINPSPPQRQGLVVCTVMYGTALYGHPGFGTKATLQRQMTAHKPSHSTNGMA